MLVCSHLLGEVERICDSLVAIDGGRLLRADNVSAMTTRADVLAVEVSEGTDELAARLAALGLPVRPRRPAAAGPAGRRRHLRPDPGRGRRAGPAAAPARPAPAPGRRALRHRADHQEARAQPLSTERRHPRHRLPALRRPPAGPPARLRRALPARPADRVRAGPQRQGEDLPLAGRRHRGRWSPLVVDRRPGARSARAGHDLRPVRRRDELAGDLFFVAVVAPGTGLPGPARAACCRCTSPGRCAAPTTRWPSSAALVTAVWLLLGGPQLLMFLGAAFTTDRTCRGVWDEFGDLLPGPGLRRPSGAVVFASLGAAGRLADRPAGVRRRRRSSRSS